MCEAQQMEGMFSEEKCVRWKLNIIIVSLLQTVRSLFILSFTRQRIKRWLIEFDNRLFWPSEVVLLKRRSINSTLHRPLLCCIEVPTLVLYVEVRMRSVMIGDPVICN